MLAPFIDPSIRLRQWASRPEMSSYSKGLEARLRVRAFEDVKRGFVWADAAALLPVVNRALALLDRPETLTRYFELVGPILSQLGLGGTRVPQTFEILISLFKEDLGPVFSSEVEMECRKLFIYASWVINQGSIEIEAS